MRLRATARLHTHARTLTRLTKHPRPPSNTVLIIGNFALSHSQAQAQMALWCIMAAPLMMGNDLRHLDPAMKAILLAKEVIAVDQDALGVQGQRVAQDKSQCGAHDVWVKPLAGGDLAVVFWNRGFCGSHSKLSANWTTLGLPAGQKMAARDLFLQADLGTFVDSVAGFVDIDGVLLLRLSKVAA